MFLTIFENIVSLLLGQLFFLSEVHCAGWPASGKIREFHNQFSNSGKSENLALVGKIRDTSCYLIMDKGKNQGFTISFLFDYHENVFEL